MKGRKRYQAGEKETLKKKEGRQEGEKDRDVKEESFIGVYNPVVFVVVPVCRVVEFECFIKAWLGLRYPNSHSSLNHKCFIYCSANLATKPRKIA